MDKEQEKAAKARDSALQSALTQVHLMHHLLSNDGPLTAGGQTAP